MNRWGRELQGKARLSPETKMYMLAHKFGWTPSQTEQQEAQIVEAFLQMIRLESKIEEARAKKQKYGKR